MKKVKYSKVEFEEKGLETCVLKSLFLEVCFKHMSD